MSEICRTVERYGHSVGEIHFHIRSRVQRLMEGCGDGGIWNSENRVACPVTRICQGKEEVAECPQRVRCRAFSVGDDLQGRTRE